MKWAGQQGPWKFHFVGDYGSSDQQLMVSYTRLTDAATARRDQRRRAVTWAQSDEIDTARTARRTSKRFVTRARRKVRRTVRNARGC